MEVEGLYKQIYWDNEYSEVRDGNLYRTSYTTVSWSEERFSNDIVMDQLHNSK